MKPYNPVPPHERASFLDRHQNTHSLMQGPRTWLYGAGAQGRDIDCEMVGLGNARFVTDETLDKTVAGDLFIPASGDPKTRRNMVEKAEARGLVLTSWVSPRAFVPENARLESGCIIMAGAVLMADVFVGRGALINIGAMIGHDCVIGEFASVQPGSNLTGRVTVGADAYIGVGATLITQDPAKPLTIGPRVIVGGGTVVYRDALEGTWVGNPARRVK